MRHPGRLRPALWLILLLLVAPTVRAQVAPAYTDVIAEARALIEAHRAEHDLPGLAVAVSVDGQTVWAEGFGYADLEHRTPVWPSTRFRVGSISKPMTAVAVAQLYADGRLDVDAPVQQYAAAFPEKRWPVTTRQVGAHLGGIRHYRGDEFLSQTAYATVDDGLAILAADTLLHEPGTRYAYSSYGWNLISAVVEGAAEEPFLAYMDEHVFRPLGMTATVADRPARLVPQRARPYARDLIGQVINAPYVDNSYKWAGGGFLSSVEDLLRFGNAVVLGDFVPEEGRALMFTEQQTTAGEGVNYGFGWSIQEDSLGRRIEHGGGSVGGTSLLSVRPDQRLVLAAASNLSGADLSVLSEVYALFQARAVREQSAIVR